MFFLLILIYFSLQIREYSVFYYSNHGNALAKKKIKYKKQYILQH